MNKNTHKNEVLFENLEDDAVRSFKGSKAGQELLEVQQRMFSCTGAYLPDSMPCGLSYLR